MSTDISVSRTAYQVENRSWLLSSHGTEPGTTPSVSFDITAFAADAKADGYIKSGTVVSKLANGKYGPFDKAKTEHGIVFSAVKATVATVGGAILVHGFVNGAKLPGAPVLADVRAALPLVHIA